VRADVAGARRRGPPRANAAHHARTLLEAAGFTVCHVSGRKGPADLIAWDTTAIRFIRVTSGPNDATALEREALQGLPRPSNASVELWRVRDRRHAPQIARL